MASAADPYWVPPTSWLFVVTPGMSTPTDITDFAPTGIASMISRVMTFCCTTFCTSTVGAAPTVDVQNVVQQKVMTRDIIDAIPVGAKSVMSVGVLIPGVTTNSQDVGGTQYGSAALAIHGSALFEQQLLYDGVYYNNGQGRGGSFTAIAPNAATIQEISYETGALSAEKEVAGLRSNIIPKDAGTKFT